MLQSGEAQVSESELKSILSEVDKDGNGEIDYEEFCAMLTMTQSSVQARAAMAQSRAKTRGNLSSYKAAQSAGVAM